MFEGILQSFSIPEVRKRILFTLGAFAIFRLGAWIPVPGVDIVQLKNFLQTSSASALFGVINLFTGNAFENFSLFALGVIPYINASIIMSLLQNVVPALKELHKQGDEGRKVLQKYIRYGTVGLAIFQSLGMGLFIVANGFLMPDHSLLLFYFTATICLTTGTMFLMWLGERITENGIGRGVSMIIMAGIIAGYPQIFGQTFTSAVADSRTLIWIGALLVVFVVVVAGVVLIQLGARRVDIQYAKRVVRGKVYGGQNTFIPFAVNQGGVIPIIFAAAILTFLQIPLQFPFVMEAMKTSDWLQWFNSQMTQFGILYLILYGLMIVFFTYFYNAIVFNPQDLSDNLRKWGGYVPGIRPGKPTSDYLERIQYRLLAIGGVFLVLIALLPYAVMGLSGLQVGFALGGTSVLIAVGVGVDTVKQIEAHMVEHHYESIIRKGAVLGR